MDTLIIAGVGFLVASKMGLFDSLRGQIGNTSGTGYPPNNTPYPYQGAPTYAPPSSVWGQNPQNQPQGPSALDWANFGIGAVKDLFGGLTQAGVFGSAGADNDDLPSGWVDPGF